ncbi:autophagy-related protein 9A [Anoplophora glabripennis]|nr:autophagy-related protein 9A [Anoplophora glabripennis]XP_018561368.1 autophagy-related protein 9A [Anoplophora glabripennis]
MQNYASLQETHDTPDDHGILFHQAEPTRSRWNHVEDLDSFFSRIYKYHQNHGFRCMLLRDIFDVNQFVFVVFLTVWLVHGINYEIMFNPTADHKPTLHEIIRGFDETFRKFKPLTWFCVIIASLFLILKILNRFYQLLQFWDIKQFYNTALGIQDNELDNLNWHEIQIKVRAVQLEQQMCIHKRELTELDIYHRILRQENYMVALVNKRLLPPRINVPFIGECVYWTKALKLNLQILLFWSPWSPFENPWHLREEYKRHNLRHELASRLGKQILWLAFTNFILAPAILVWEVLYTFFYYTESIRREPGRIGIRNWSLYGKLYFRHFNELDHELQARLTRAYRPSTKYLSAFSSPLVTIIAQHIGFICGSLLAILLLFTVYDGDVIVVEHFITLMTVLGGTIAICRGVVPEESMVWCPESLLQAVVVHTHYMVSDWKSHAHTSRVREGFQQLFQYRFVALFEQLVSPIMTPFLLIWWIYPRSLEIVDFFRHFTVSVVGVGDVCSFAQMDVKKHGNPNWQKASLESMDAVTPDHYSQAEDGKVELSLVHFTTTNPNWVPPPEAQMFVDNILDDMQDYSDSDIFYGSVQNLVGQASVTEFEGMPHSFPNLRETRATLQSFAASSFPRNSVWKAEGPNMFGPLAMRQSCIALHDRNFRQTERAARSLEETTPLLPGKSF